MREKAKKLAAKLVNEGVISIGQYKKAADLIEKHLVEHLLEFEEKHPLSAFMIVGAAMFLVGLALGASMQL